MTAEELAKIIDDVLISNKDTIEQLGTNLGLKLREKLLTHYQEEDLYGSSIVNTAAGSIANAVGTKISLELFFRILIGE
jgi:predicted 2-oxoglutarate/Fe(II)-dependent dioxygenase YbiX